MCSYSDVVTETKFSSYCLTFLSAVMVAAQIRLIFAFESVVYRGLTVFLGKDNRKDFFLNIFNFITIIMEKINYIFILKILRSSGKRKILRHFQIRGVHKYCSELLSVPQLQEIWFSMSGVRPRNLNFCEALPGDFDEYGSGTLLWVSLA